jgi:hypothetical protein
MAFASAIVMNNSERSLVLVLGDYPVEKAEFVERRLSLTPITIQQLDDDNLICGARGILLSSFPDKFALFKSYFENNFFRACELGLMTAACVVKKSTQVSALRNEAYTKAGLFEDIGDPTKRMECFDALPWVYLSDKLCAIAETFARYEPGPPLGTTEIDSSSITEPLSRDAKVLLKRAFYDCDLITVERLTGGKTTKETFRVFANLAGPEFGPQPMPFFVKMGSPESIAYEKRNYRTRAEPFIPFPLRPSLIEARCATTLTSAALACNFVPSAVSLRDALQTGQGDGAIFSLFEFTLRGLRSHTLNAPKRPRALQTFFDPKNGRVRTNEIEEKWPSRIEGLHNYPKSRKPKEVEKVLRQFAAQVEAREGTYHGDLHAGNIMVRNRDAIVIDFGSMTPFGPLSADPAILEVSLVFGTDNHDKASSFDAWREFVDHIFFDPLSPPPPKAGYHQFAWLHKAIRELRHVVTCCGVERNEALIILAGCLLRFGRLTPPELNSSELMSLAENRTVYALVVADQITKKLEEPHAAC